MLHICVYIYIIPIFNFIKIQFWVVKHDILKPYPGQKYYMNSSNNHHLYEESNLCSSLKKPTPWGNDTPVPLPVCLSLHRLASACLKILYWSHKLLFCNEMALLKISTSHDLARKKRILFKNVEYREQIAALNSGNVKIEKSETINGF